jgi:glycosyltransferase involved in cell wall biosynthesis
VPTVSNLPTVEVPVEKRGGFVFAARWIENKGADKLVAAYAQAGLDPEQWPLRMLGDGPLRGWLLEEVRAHGIRGIEMPGFVTEEEKHRATASARWMVVPPHTNEDMGLTAIESRSVGVPVIATRDGGLPEAAGPGALLCEPGDVEDLARVLQEAAAMPDEIYRERAQLAKSSLKGYLVPLSFYTEQYRIVCGFRC